MDSPYASLMDVDGNSYLEHTPLHQPQQPPQTSIAPRRVLPEPLRERAEAFKAAVTQDEVHRRAQAAAGRLPSTSPPSTGPFNNKRTFDTFHQDNLKERMRNYEVPVTKLPTVRKKVHFTPPSKSSPPHKKPSPISRKPSPPKRRGFGSNVVTIPLWKLRQMRANGECNQVQLDALYRAKNFNAEERDGLRRTYRTFTASIYSSATSLYHRVWTFITGLFQKQEQEIISVQIDQDGRKRRAVSGSQIPAHTVALPAISAVESLPTHTASQIPGGFPDVEMTDAALEAAEVSTQLTTPPDSRPGSREGHEKKHDSPMAAAQKLSAMTDQSSKPKTPVKSTQERDEDTLSTIETSPTNTDTTIATNATPELKPLAMPIATNTHRASNTSPEAHAQQEIPLQKQPARVGHLPFTRHIPLNYTPAMIVKDLDKLVAEEKALAAKADSSRSNNEPKNTYRGVDRQPGQSAADWIMQRNRRLKTRLPLDARQYTAPSRRQFRKQQEADKPAEAEPSLNESVLRNMQKDAKVEQLVEKAKQTIINSPPSNKKLNRSANEHVSAKKDDVQENVSAEVSRKDQQTINKDELDLGTNKNNVQESVITKSSPQFKDLSINDAKKTATETTTAQEAAATADLSSGDITFSSLGDFDMNEFSDPDFSKYNEKQKIIRPLPEEWSKRVDEAMAVKNRREVLATAIDGTGLSRHDFGCLLPQSSSNDVSHGWLNDEIVNAWIAAITDEKNKQKDYNKSGNRVPLFVGYSSAWYVTYQSKGVEGISRWSRRKGIQGPKLLECEKVFFPINTGAHWQLLIISPKKREIEFLNSINDGGHDSRSKQFFKLAREWLQMELNEAYVAGEWTDKTESVSAQQTNSDDCGAFVCFNALISAKGKGEYTDLALPGYEMQPFGRRLMAAILLNGGFTGDWML